MGLREGETIIHKGRPHWIVFEWAIFFALLSARFVLGAELATSRGMTQTLPHHRQHTSFYALVAGYVAQFYRHSVLVEFPTTGRLFNYGTPSVRGFGGSRELIKRIRTPEHVRELIHCNSRPLPVACLVRGQGSPSLTLPASLEHTGFFSPQLPRLRA